MKCLASILFATVVGVSCAGDDGYPIHPQGSPPVVGSADPGQPATITGRICRLEDLRDPTSCADGDLGGLVVTLGDETAITDPDGTFTIDTSPGSLQSFGVSGAGVVPTTTPFSSSTLIRAVDADVFARTFTSNGILLPPDTGSVLGTLVRGGLPAVGVTVTSNPTPAFGPFFDGAEPNTFTLVETGAFGTVLLPGVAAGPTSLTFTDGAGSSTDVISGVQVVPGGVTVIDAVLPASTF